MNERRQPDRRGKRLYVKLSDDFDEMDAAQLHDWASQIVDRMWPDECGDDQEVSPPNESEK